MQSSHALTGSSVGKEPTFNAGDQVRSLGREGPLEEEMATRSSLLAWRISWTEKPGGLQARGLHKLDMTLLLNHHLNLKKKKKPFLGLNISLEKMIYHFDSKTFKTPVSFFL